MRQVTGNMSSVVKGMDKAMESMNLERVRHTYKSSYTTTTHTMRAYFQISMVMDKFETQFTDLDVQTAYMEDAMGATTAVSTPQDQIDLLLRQTAEEANIELQHDLEAKDANVLAEPSPKDRVLEEDGKLAERLRALRPAT
jgi:charged multivesicular body protein 1